MEKDRNNMEENTIKTEETVPETEKQDMSAQEEQEPKKRRGLFGGKKRERNDRTVLGLYTVAAVYLLYVAFVTGDELIKGKVPAGRDFVISTIFVVVFGGTAIWLLFTCWKLKKAIKQREEIEMAEAAEKSAQDGTDPEPPVKKGSMLKNLFSAPRAEEPSVASRASVYRNPADDDDDKDKEGETAPDQDEES